MKKIEYRVRPVTRYIVTRYEEEKFNDPQCEVHYYLMGDGRCSCRNGASNAVYGEFDNVTQANRVCKSLAFCENVNDNLTEETGKAEYFLLMPRRL